MAKPTIYAAHRSRIAFAASYLDGPALRFYNNLIRRERTGEHVPILHYWHEFLALFSRTFGLHDEVLHSQANLDQIIQRYSETFADFFVRFEDVALLTHYNDAAKRWRLLKQIRPDLRNRLTNNGRIPPDFEGVVERLFDIDGARQAFNDVGLGTFQPNTHVVNANPQPNAQLLPAPANPVNVTVSTPANAAGNSRWPYRNRNQNQTNQAVGKQAEVATNNVGNSPEQENERNRPRVPSEIWNRRL